MDFTGGGWGFKDGCLSKGIIRKRWKRKNTKSQESELNGSEIYRIALSCFAVDGCSCDFWAPIRY